MLQIILNTDDRMENQGPFYIKSPKLINFKENGIEKKIGRKKSRRKEKKEKRKK